MRAVLLSVCLTGCILGCSRQVEVVDSAEQAAQREQAKKDFDRAHYIDLSQPVGAKPAQDKDKPADDKSQPGPPEKQ